MIASSCLFKSSLSICGLSSCFSSMSIRSCQLPSSSQFRAYPAHSRRSQPLTAPWAIGQKRDRGLPVDASGTQPPRNIWCHGWLLERLKRRSQAMQQPVMQALLKTARQRLRPGLEVDGGLGTSPFRRDCCQYYCQERSQLQTQMDRPGTSAQYVANSGHSWTTCPCLRI